MATNTEWSQEWAEDIIDRTYPRKILVRRIANSLEEVALRCAEIASERPHRKGYTIADKICREFGLTIPESNSTPVGRAMERFHKRIEELKAEGKFPPTPKSDSTESANEH